MIFRLANGFRRRAKPVIRRSVRLGLEALETRDCPSPTITGFSATPTNAPGTHQVELKGTVSDANASYVSVQFGGVVSASTSVQGSGSFDIFTNASGLGKVSAVATDQQGSSGTVWTTLTSPAPVITSFVVIAGPAGTYTLEGHVNVPEPQGAYVTFSGPPGVNGLGANVDAYGNFQVTCVLGSHPGGITAVATDVWDQASAPFYDPLC